MTLYVVIHNVKMEYTQLLHDDKSDFLCNLTKENGPKKRNVCATLGVYMESLNRPIKLNQFGKFKK